MTAPAYPFTNLVFEGGGVKGIAYVGALQVLQQHGILPEIRAVAGTSAGAITAALVAAGYSPDELGQTMMSLDLRKFEDGRLEGPVRVVEKFGWFRGDDFLDWLRSQLAAKLGSPEVTFAELAQARSIDLRVVTTDLGAHAPVTLSAATTPDTQVAEAVRMSMSIPLFFASVRSDGHVYVDGGAVWNYPIEMFDTEEGPNRATLGLHLSRQGSPPPPPATIDDLASYGRNLYEAISQVQGDYFLRIPDDVARSVLINDLGLRATDFDITEQQKQALVQEGVKATTAYLDAFKG